MFTNRESAAFLRVRRSSSRLGGVRTLAIAAGLACAASAMAQPGSKDDSTTKTGPSPTPRSVMPPAAPPPRVTSPAPRTPISRPPVASPAPRAQDGPAPRQVTPPRAQPSSPSPSKTPSQPSSQAPRPEPVRPADPPSRSSPPTVKPSEPPTRVNPGKPSSPGTGPAAPSTQDTPIKPSRPSSEAPSGPRTAPSGPKVVDVKPSRGPRDGSTNVPVKPGTPASPVRPANPGTTGGFKPAGPAPRTDPRQGDATRGANYLPSAPVPAEATRRVSDRATRFSQVDGASPINRDARGRGDRRNSWGSRDHDDHVGYWDGYRDGYRRGYRNGYRDGFWDDCWAPSWRHHSTFGLWFSSGCWSGWSVSIGWGSPGYYGWYTPVHYYPSVWYYRPLVSYSTVTTSSWDGSTSVTTTYYNSAPRLEVVDFCDEICAPTTIVYQPATRVVAGPRVVNVELPNFQPTVYRSTELAGVMGWNDTPESVLGAVGSTGTTDRAGSAAQFLGRIPAGGWDVGYEGERIVEGQRELLFRGLSPNPRGQRAQVVLVPKGPVGQLYPGQRVQITGRLAEICVDDPYEQAGRLTLADGSVRN